MKDKYKSTIQERERLVALLLSLTMLQGFVANRGNENIYSSDFVLEADLDNIDEINKLDETKFNFVGIIPEETKLEDSNAEGKKLARVKNDFKPTKNKFVRKF